MLEVSIRIRFYEIQNSSSPSSFPLKFDTTHITTIATFLDRSKMNLCYPTTVQTGGVIPEKGHNIRNSPERLTAPQSAYPAAHVLPQMYNFFKRIKYATFKMRFRNINQKKARRTEAYL